jgi:hypothetical protein
MVKAVQSEGSFGASESSSDYGDDGQQPSVCVGVLKRAFASLLDVSPRFFYTSLVEESPKFTTGFSLFLTVCSRTRQCLLPNGFYLKDAVNSS